MSDKPKAKHHPVNAELEFDFIPGPVKIKDGLFMGDELAAKDVEFIITNKVSHIINTVCRRIPCIWEKIGVQYLCFNWSDNEQNVFDKKNSTANIIYNFIEDALEEGKSCLVHSVNAKSRSFLVVAAYLMKKYGWSLQKARDFTNSKKEKLAVRQGFIQQLKDLELRLSKSVLLSQNWEEAKNEEQLVLNNTFKNSKVILWDTTHSSQVTKPKKRVGWLETESKLPIKYIQEKRGPLFKESKVEKASFGKLKSILKNVPGSKLEEVLKPEQSPIQPQVGIKQGKSNIASQRIVPKQENGKMVVDEIAKNGLIQNKEPIKFDTVKKPPHNPLLSRPYSSDAKERDKKKQTANQNVKKLTYDNFMTNLKSPYEAKVLTTKLATRVTRPGVNGSLRKQQEPYKPSGTFYQRPQSSSTTEKRKMRLIDNPPKGTSVIKPDELVITNSKPSKLGASILSREQGGKWKQF